MKSRIFLAVTLLLTCVVVGAGAREGVKMRNAFEDYSRPADGELSKTLTPEQYSVARENGTEPPFRNAYWDNHADGIYVDVVSGEPLFSSRDKFDSGTGWPSFTRPLEAANMAEKSDSAFGMRRVEVRSK